MKINSSVFIKAKFLEQLNNKLLLTKDTVLKWINQSAAVRV